ncbi:endonuclease/exonuclease/phosphatase family protein [Microbacterium sp. zg.Y909]|uniref:endonuclease/exonuclease/phosphatase family protein n=1 Tax=Microbacterium sp. zg.Y909 TaxID=2969413 RepID=UPI00214CD33A|nr:endonuclease/exonuclease/phosphatase family protein [Microbacterium sp. zg.Y909]MCR2826879.1 endonuclease/exonuclease/phosphatase family protein [Microbacterium sp. zg.Y909]
MTDPLRPLIGPVATPDLHVMTFNIRRRMPALLTRPADRWARRAPRLRGVLRAERPTVLGVQEALPDQAAAIAAALGPTHRFVGHGRDPRREGEACPLFYDAERLELLDWRQSALSDRPEQPGSTTWGNVIPRILVQADFRDRATSAEFMVVNTHLDVLSSRARLRGAQHIRRLVAGQPRPAVVMGDLNAGPSSPAVGNLLAGDTLVDAWTAAAEHLTPEWGTYGGYRRPRTAGDRIDWIAVSPSAAVVTAAVNADPVDGGWASDHFPVQAVLRMPRSESSP